MADEENVSLTPSDLYELDQLRSQAKVDQAAALDDAQGQYTDLVVAIASGEEVGIEDIEHVLTAAAKSDQEFARDLDELGKAFARETLGAIFTKARLNRMLYGSRARLSDLFYGARLQ